MLIFGPLNDGEFALKVLPLLIRNLPPVAEEKTPAGSDLIHWMLVAIIYIKR